MIKSKYIWLNGRFVSWGRAKTHVLDYALHYGAGVFEGIRAYKTKNNTAIFRLNEHIDRLYKSASSILMEIPYSKEEIKNTCIETIRKNKLDECYIRPIAWFGLGGIGIGVKAPVNVAIIAVKFGEYFGKGAKENGIKAKIVDIIRPHPKSFPANSKITGSYVISRIAKVKAKTEGYDEAILLDYNNNIAEGSGENIFVVKENVLYTPPVESILEGITRNSVIEIAKDIGLKVEEKFFDKEFLYNADEAFFTGTAAEITPIIQVDDKIIGNGKIGEITKKIQEIFESIVRGENEKYSKWLTEVY